MSKPQIVIEYPSVGKTYHEDRYGVYSYDTFPESSVLAGQERRSFIDSYESLEEAKRNHPEAEWHGEGTGFVDRPIPMNPPEWFDHDNAGEYWSEEDAY